MTIEMIPLSNIRVSKSNPRKAVDAATIEGLAASIKADGLLQNLVLAKKKGRGRTYEIISGERRYRALSLLVERGDLPADVTIPADIRSGLSDADMLRVATVENLQRENLTPLEEADALNTLIGCGGDLDTLTAQSGLSVSTIKRRVALLRLGEAVRAALEAGEISLAQAEALSIGAHSEQENLLQSVVYGWMTSPEDIREALTDRLPSLADAIFPKDAYTGAFITDLFGEDDTTYFSDTEQFFALQKAAAEKLVTQHEKTADWAMLAEGGFAPWEYRQANEDESGGVVVELTVRGAVEVHVGLIREDVAADLEEAVKPKARPLYSKAVIEYIAMQKSAAVQATLLENPHTAKALDAARRMVALCERIHACPAYLTKLGENSPALDTINAAASEVLAIILPDTETATWLDLLRAARSPEKAFALLKPLAPEALERVCHILSVLEFGQDKLHELDTTEDSLFNMVAREIGVEMTRWWQPGEWFLSRRTMNQLSSIIKDAGVARLYGNGRGYKKADLVRSLAGYFAKLRAMETRKPDQQRTADWLPEGMSFPDSAAPREAQPEAQSEEQAA